MKLLTKISICLAALLIPAVALADLSYNPEHDAALKNLHAVESATVNLQYQCGKYTLIINAYATQSEVSGRRATVTGKIMSGKAILNINDGSQSVAMMENSCGIGNPCPDAPPDADDELTEEQECKLEQATEAGIDQLAQQIAQVIATMNSAIEHGTFIVEHNGQLIALVVISGTPTALNLRGLYDQMNALGISDTQIRGFIHSHPPSTNSNSIAAIAENLINGFPSGHDYNAYQTFANNAQAFGANRSEWEGQFNAYVVDSNGVVREYEEFSQPSSQDFSNGIPKPGDPGYSDVQNELDEAQGDAQGKC